MRRAYVIDRGEQHQMSRYVLRMGNHRPVFLPSLEMAQQWATDRGYEKPTCWENETLAVIGTHMRPMPPDAA